MNIADIASQVRTVYDRTLLTSLTLPYSGFENIAIAQNDIVSNAVINNAINKLYSNYIQLYRYSNLASNVIPVSSIAFIGSIYNNSGASVPHFNVTSITKTVTSYVTTPVTTVTPSYKTTLTPITSYETTFTSVTSYNTITTPVTTYNTVTIALTSYNDIPITPQYHVNLFYYSDNLLYSNPANGWIIYYKDYEDSFTKNVPIASSVSTVVYLPQFMNPFYINGAFKFVEGSNNEIPGLLQYRPEVVVVGNQYVVSVYAKAAERNLLWMSLGGDYGVFDLTDGVTSIISTQKSTQIYANSQYVGNGWYRCILTDTINSNFSIIGSVRFGTLISKSGPIAYKGDGKSGIYLYGPQLTFGGTIYPYVGTTDTQIGTIALPTNKSVLIPVTQSFTKTFTSSTNWIVPAEVTLVTVSVVGGGGGGGEGESDVFLVSRGGGGGGSGGSATGIYSVVAGSVIPITVGEGGASNGGSGGSSSFGNYIFATGGSGGRSADTSANILIGGAGGAGGVPMGVAGSEGGSSAYIGGGEGFGGAGGGSGVGAGGVGGVSYRNVSYPGAGAPGASGAVTVTYTQTIYNISVEQTAPPNIQPLYIPGTIEVVPTITSATSSIETVTNTQSVVANVVEEQQISASISYKANTTSYLLSTTKFIHIPYVSTVTYDNYNLITLLDWYTTSNFSSTSQFEKLSYTQYQNLDNIQTIAGGINTFTSPNNYVIFASTGTDLIALTGDVTLHNVSVALSTNTTALFSNIGFTGINKLILDQNTNYLYVVDLSANLIHQFNAAGFLTNENILTNKLVYIKSIGGYGNYDDAHLFNNPRNIAIYNSNLYVLDSGNSCIKQYDTDFNWITTHRLFRDFNNNYPIDIVTDNNGGIHVLTNTNKIISYNNDFSVTTVTSLPVLENASEYYTGINTSIVDGNIFYLITNYNVYKKFYSSIDDTIGKYLFYRFNVDSNENIVAFTSLAYPLNSSDTNVIFSLYNGAGKFGFYADNINLDTTLVTKDFDIYPLSSIQVGSEEYVQNWVFNKALAKLIINHTRLRNLIFSRFLYEPDEQGVLTYQGIRYMTPDELLSVTFDQDLTNFIGSNEIFQNAIINRAIKFIYDGQVSILNMLQSDIETAPDLNIPVYIN